MITSFWYWQAADAELNLANSCLELIGGLSAAATEVAKRWRKLRSSVTFANGTSSSTDQSISTVVARSAPDAHAFDKLTDKSLRDFVVGLVYLLSRNERQPEVAGAASSLLLILAKVWLPPALMPVRLNSLDSI